MSHEIFETATDPAYFNGTTGWSVHSPSQEDELGDGCEGTVQSITFNNGSSGSVQGLRDAIQGGGCNVWTPEHLSPISAVSQTVSTVTESDVFGWSSNKNVTHLTGDTVFGWSIFWTDLGGPTEAPPVAVAGAAGPQK